MHANIFAMMRTVEEMEESNQYFFLHLIKLCRRQILADAALKSITQSSFYLTSLTDICFKIPAEESETHIHV